MVAYSQKLKYPFLVPMLILLLVQCIVDPQVPSAPVGKALTPTTEHLGGANDINMNSILETGYIAFIMSQSHPVDNEVRYTSAIYTMRGDGEHLIPVVKEDSHNLNPVWSPDGQKIAFVSNRTGNSEIYVVNKDGSNLTRLTENNADDYAPAWSPDGHKIAFTSNRDDNNEIYVMDSDGSSVERLTHNTASDSSPIWSPDGEKIAFISSRDFSPSDPRKMFADLYIMDKNVENVRRLTKGQTASSPVWSPDGRYIAFVQASFGVRQLHIMILDTETGTINPLTNYDIYPSHKDHPMDAVVESFPSWSSCGNYIIFQAFIPYEGFYTYIARVKQGKAVELKRLLSDATQPHWWNP